MNVLFLTHYFAPEVGAPQTRILELGRRLVSRGHSVTVLTGFPNYPTGITPTPYQGHLHLREEMAGMRVVRAWVFATPNAGFFRRLLNHLSLTLTSIPAAFGIGPVDVMIVESPPLFLGIAGYIISRVKRAPYVFNVADLWPETAVALGALKNPWLIDLAERLEWFLYRRAARVTTVTRGIRHTIVERGMPPDRVMLLTNGVDTDRFHPSVDPSPAEQELGLDGRLTVAYAGTHGMAQGLEILVEAAALLRNQKGIRFVMVGEGAEKPGLMSKAAQLGLKNLDFFPNQPTSFMPHLWAAVDIAVVSLRRLDIFHSALPSKLFEIMATECPVVMAAEGEARDLILRAKAGVVVEPENATELAEAVLQLAADASARRQYGRNGRCHVREHFNREYLADLWEAELTRVVGGAT
jgi:glycosyltransferase involved in cell wall biosynthesis